MDYFGNVFFNVYHWRIGIMFDIGLYYIGRAMNYFVGEMLLCNKDLFFRDSSEKVFTENKYYVVADTEGEDGDTLYLLNNNGDEHGVTRGSWLEYFSKLKPFERKLKFT